MMFLGARWPLALSAAAAPDAPQATPTGPGIELRDSLAGTGDRRAPLSLVVNGVPKADAIFVILRGSDVLVAQSDLQAAQVPLPGAAFVDVNGVRYVSLASLAPNVTFRVDVAALALDLQIATSLLGRSTVAVGAPGATRELAKADPSAFVSYSLSSSTVNLGQQAAGYVLAGAGSATTGLFTTSAAYGSGEGRRGLTAFQKESEQRLSSYTIGDDYASTGNLGANVVVAGFGVTRHFEYQPGYAYFPTPGVSGTALSPTTADLYVNGSFLRSVQIAPGAFDLSGIPVPPGAGVTQVVLRDAYGNIQTLSGLYYQTRQVLRKGLTDYDYHVGFVRPNPFGSNDNYGPLAALGEYRVGLTNALTVGGRFERTAGTTSGGPQVDVALPVGHVSLSAAGSSAYGARGDAYGAAYDYSGRHFSINLAAQSESVNYSTASLQANAPRQRSSVRESLNWPFAPNATFCLSNTVIAFSAQPIAAQLLAGVTLKRRHGLFITLSAERDTGSIVGIAVPRTAAQWTFGIQASLQTSGSSNLTVGANAGATASTTMALSKSAPTGPGFGYQLAATAGNDRSAAMQFAYQTQYGNAQLLTTAGQGADATTMTVAGGLVAFRQGVFFTQPVSGAYSLVTVPGFAGLPVFFNNQFAGRTDGRDAMVLPYLSPYYDNQIRIDDLRGRLDLAEDSSVNTVRPKTLSGVVSQFTIRHFHAYAGHIVIERNGEPLVPSLGRVTFNRAGQAHQYDLGREGQFYVEDLEPGSYAATVETGTGLTCAFSVTLPADASPVTPVGTRYCELSR